MMIAILLCIYLHQYLCFACYTSPFIILGIQDHQENDLALVLLEENPFHVPLEGDHVLLEDVLVLLEGGLVPQGDNLAHQEDGPVPPGDGRVLLEDDLALLEDDHVLLEGGYALPEEDLVPLEDDHVLQGGGLFHQGSIPAHQNHGPIHPKTINQPVHQKNHPL